MPSTDKKSDPQNWIHRNVMVVPTLQINTVTSSTSYIWILVPSGMWRRVVAFICGGYDWNLLPPSLWQR